MSDYILEEEPFDPEALAFDIAFEQCEVLGGNNHTIDWVIVDDDVVVGFACRQMKDGRYKVKFFRSHGINGDYYSSNDLDDMVSWTVPYIKQLLVDNNFTITTQDEPDKMIYRSLLVLGEPK